MFNQDSQDPSKVNLLHLSGAPLVPYEEVLDLSLDYIWKMMHCQSIRIYLHHYLQPTEADPATEKLRVNEEIKSLLKQRRFRWKTLKNETETGMRIEQLEGLNLEFKEQTKQETAFIYRRGLSKEDFMRHTLSIELTSRLVDGKTGS